ncbi:MAG: sigma-70 family RNA polymerase sigma factor [Bacteroidia bacterium]
MENDYVELIQAIKKGEKGYLKEIYNKYRKPFLEWSAASYQFPEHEAKDIYQQVILIFYENIIEGKIERIRSNIRTYLFGIGKMLIRQEYRKGTRFTQIENETGEIIPEYEEMVEGHRLELTEKEKVMKMAIKSLGDTCRNILTLYYYHRFTTESVMNRLGYKNTDVVKSQKVRCMKSLKKIIETNFDKDLR